GAALAACTEDPPAAPPRDEWDDRLAQRVVDYSAALRVAALRLTGELPTLAEVHQVADAPDGAPRKAAYEALLDRYLATPRFTRQMFRFWQDTLKLGDDPLLDTAPAFVTKLIVDDRSFLDALTATTGACTSYDVNTGQFAAGDCRNAPVTVGLLT